MDKNNIEKVLDNHLCTGCGVCSNVCPIKCIKTELNISKGYYITTLNREKCIGCGLCQKVCPIYTWDNKMTNKYVGNYLKVYSGYSCNTSLRKECASGGITTSILLYLLKNKKIDAVALATRDTRNPLYSKMVLINTEEEIIRCKGSVYAPTSYVEIIKAINSTNYKKVAIVGLPCHIQAISAYEKINACLKEKIYLKISLVCGHTPSLKAYEYSLKHLNIKKDEVHSISNRGDGWPGYFKIETINTSLKKISYGSKYSWGMVFSSPLFTPKACSHCVDPTGFLADISIGDAWLPKFRNDKIGRNLVLIRSQKVLTLFLEMQKETEIEIIEENVDEFIKANIAVFKQKLIINGIRNKKVQRNYSLYKNINFLPANSRLACFFIKVLDISECCFNKFFGVQYINNSVLFFFKTLKYLSEKWLKTY